MEKMSHFWIGNSPAPICLSESDTACNTCIVYEGALGSIWREMTFFLDPALNFKPEPLGAGALIVISGRCGTDVVSVS
jgi:hypothetical protein